ncbi:MAG: YiiG family protein [Lachnospiraceae bacterium]|jgi:hypothetical protein|nr:YiiG family protein [Lachnospiraceae bacterium]NBJ82077.1 DUF3829 domain-containing protein [bacterium 1XD42-76]NBK05357.1 DUF3829 domain-containing protein [bacterium 1XD42-94]
MQKKTPARIAAILILALALSGCNKDESGESTEAGHERSISVPTTPVQTTEAEETLSAEQMDLIKYNYYVDLNNDIVDILDSIGYYYDVVDYTEEFSLLPDTGLTYGYRVYGKNTDIIDDCLQLADMEPDYGELDDLVREMADPLRDLMDTFSNISSSHDYADNQYQKAKDYHAVIYSSADTFAELGYAYMEAISEMGNLRIAEEEEAMKEEGRLIIYNASRAISIGKQVLDVVDDQEISDETITDLDLTEIRRLHEELVAVVADFDAATADNDQLIKESLANSRPFDGLYNSLIQALEWMIKQVESGRPLDLSGSGAPLGSIGHFSEVLSKCIERYNSVFVE